MYNKQSVREQYELCEKRLVEGSRNKFYEQYPNSSDTLQCALLANDQGHCFKSLMNNLIKDSDASERNFAFMHLELNRSNEVCKAQAIDLIWDLVSFKVKEVLRDTDVVLEMYNSNNQKLRMESDVELAIFICLIEQIEAIGKIASRVLGVFKDRLSVRDHKIKIAANIGIAIYPRSGNTYEALCKKAERAVGEARRKGELEYHCYEQCK